MSPVNKPQKIKVLDEEDNQSQLVSSVVVKEEKAPASAKTARKTKTKPKTTASASTKKTVKTRTSKKISMKNEDAEAETVIKRIKKTNDIIAPPKPSINTVGAAMVENQENKEVSWIIKKEDKPKEVPAPIPAQATAPAPVSGPPASGLEKANNKETSIDPLASSKNIVKEIVQESIKQDEVKIHDQELVQESKSRRSVKLYRRIAYSFVLLTAVLVAVVSYFTFVKVEITLIPNQERLSNNLIFDIYDQAKNTPANESALPGAVQAITITDEKTYDATGGDILGEEVVGTVKLVNNYNKNQPLVATTRLLSADGKLFRLKNTVNVPAGGSVSAEVYADDPKEEMAIGPTRFSIPGLWAGLQEQIYAENTASFSYQKKMNKKVTAADVDGAASAIADSIIEKAKSQISDTYSSYKIVIYKLDEGSIETKVNAKAGDEVDTFTASITADVIVAAFDDVKAVEMAKAKFVSGLGQNKELVSFEDSNIIYSLNNFDIAAGQATVSANFEGKVSLKQDAKIVEIDKVLGLNNDQLNAYLSGIPDLAGYEVKYYPNFIKKVPRLADRVKIEIKK